MTPAEAHAAAVEAARKMADAVYMTHTMAHSDGLIRAYLAALERAGWKVVPREATEGMLSAGWKEVGAMKQGQHGWRRICADSYRAMYDAAPAFTEGA